MRSLKPGSCHGMRLSPCQARKGALETSAPIMARAGVRFGLRFGFRVCYRVRQPR